MSQPNSKTTVPTPTQPADLATGDYDLDTANSFEPVVADKSQLLTPAEQPGELGRLGIYRVLKLLGQGGMGFVYHAEDTLLGRAVALKVMRPEVAAKAAAKDRFLREGRAAAKVKNDHVVTIHAVGEANGVPFMALEFLEGKSLDDWLKEHPAPVPLVVLLKVARDVLKGLAAAHEKDLVHRDIKPANLWLEKGTSRVKVLDFGLTRDVGGADQVTQSGMILGTPAYMAPEQASGKTVDGRTDLFSLGVVLHRMVSGKSPFQRGEIYATLTALALDEPQSLTEIAPAIPSAVSAWVAKLLMKNAEDRPASAKAALAELAAIEKALKPTNTPAAATPTLPPPMPVMNANESLPVEQPINEPPGLPRWNEKETETQSTGINPVARKGAKKLLALGFLGLALALVAGFIIIKVTNKDGTVTELKVPDGSKVEVTDGSGKTVVIEPNPKKDTLAKVDPPKIIEQPKIVIPPAPITKGDETSYDLGNGVKLEMIAINAKGKSFLMGSPKDEPERNGSSKELGDDPEEQHEVTFAHNFAMGKYEVTQEQYEAIMGGNPANYTGAKRPVEKVSWNDAQEFIKKLNDKFKDRKVKFRLPSEAEWEYACRAGTTTGYNTGKTLTKADAQFDGTSNEGTKPVGSFKPNAFGLYDMHGNVREWCEDYAGPYSKAPKDGAAQLLKQSNDIIRVVRGGSWYYNARNCRSAYRVNSSPSSRYSFIGFRLVASQDDSTGSAPPLAKAPFDAAQAKAHQEAWAKHLGVKIETPTSAGGTMVLIPPSDSVPKPFYMGKYEVTQAEWEKVMGYNPSEFSANGRGKDKVAGMATSRFPVETANWYDSVEFCNKLSEREGLKPYYDLQVTKRGGKHIDDAEVQILGGNGYHIPTDAEWTWACAAGATTNYHFGDRGNELLEYAWFDKHADRRTHDVGEKKPNVFGVYDMHGNVLEWNEEILTNADTGASERVRRGGSWNLDAGFCSVSFRGRSTPANRTNFLGLRIARAATEGAMTPAEPKIKDEPKK